MANDNGRGTEVASRETATQELAKRHFEIEPGLTHVFRLTSGVEVETAEVPPIRLLEVNEGTVPAGVMPLHFGPAFAAGIPYPSTIIEVTPDEFEQIKSESLKLPPGWQIGEEIPKPALGGD